MKLADSNRFYLNGTGERFLHLATVHEQLREYMCFMDLFTQKVYIEEITGGSLQFIEDESLAEELHAFLVDKGVLGVSRPTLPDDEWLTKGKAT